jgi:hypothetical protein
VGCARGSARVTLAGRSLPIRSMFAGRAARAACRVSHQVVNRPWSGQITIWKR